MLASTFSYILYLPLLEEVLMINFLLSLLGMKDLIWKLSLIWSLGEFFS